MCVDANEHPRTSRLPMLMWILTLTLCCFAVASISFLVMAIVLKNPPTTWVPVDATVVSVREDSDSDHFQTLAFYWGMQPRQQEISGRGTVGTRCRVHVAKNDPSRLFLDGTSPPMGKKRQVLVFFGCLLLITLPLAWLAVDDRLRNSPIEDVASVIVRGDREQIARLFVRGTDLTPQQIDRWLQEVQVTGLWWNTCSWTMNDNSGHYAKALVFSRGEKHDFNVWWAGTGPAARVLAIQVELGERLTLGTVPSWGGNGCLESNSTGD